MTPMYDPIELENLASDILDKHTPFIQSIRNGLYLVTGDSEFKIITGEKGVAMIEDAFKREIEKYGTTE